MATGGQEQLGPKLRAHFPCASRTRSGAEGARSTLPTALLTAATPPRVSLLLRSRFQPSCRDPTWAKRLFPAPYRHRRTPSAETRGRGFPGAAMLTEVTLGPSRLSKP